MKNIVTALLLGSSVIAGKSLRRLAEGDWFPDICADDGVDCALQDDGYWFMD